MPQPLNFDRIARPYRTLEYLTLGPILQRTRTHHIPSLLHTQRALILGDGDGRFTAALLRAHPALLVEAVDLSAAMLALLRQNAAHAHPTGAIRLTTHQTDLLTHTPARHPDLIVTHFVLDCLTQPELDHLIERLAPLLTPGAVWLVSDFRIPRGLFAVPARLAIRALYFAFRLLTHLRVTALPDHATPLRRAGLTRIAVHRPLFGLLTTELWQR